MPVPCVAWIDKTYTALRDLPTPGGCADAANVVEAAGNDERNGGLTAEWLPAEGTSVPAFRHGELGTIHYSICRSEMLLDIING